MPRKNLVIGVVGDESHHSTWLSTGVERSYDVCLVYFGQQPGRFAGDAEHYVAAKGIKYALLNRLFHTELAGLWEQYEAVWLPDDDLAADPVTINRLFALAAEYQLQVAQPAIRSGEVSFRALRAQTGYRLRYVRFVEMQCPLFARSAMERVAPLFALNKSGWGLDWLWSSLFAETEVAVIDAAAVDHLRPLRKGGVHTRLAQLGIEPEADHRQIVQRFDLAIDVCHKDVVRGIGRWRGVNDAGETVWTQPRWTQFLPRKWRPRCAA
jgi:hypothetical protein